MVLSCPSASIELQLAPKLWNAKFKCEEQKQTPRNRRVLNDWVDQDKTEKNRASMSDVESKPRAAESKVAPSFSTVALGAKALNVTSWNEHHLFSTGCARHRVLLCSISILSNLRRRAM